MAYTSYQLGQMVAETAARYGINPRVAVEQIRQESGFNPNARSPQGAVGIAQFMPGTGRAYGLAYPEDFLDPIKAVDAYARHMRDLLRNFGGDYRLALAAYHSGEGAARAALANPTGNPRTANYVNTILSRAGDLTQTVVDFTRANAQPITTGAIGIFLLGFGLLILLRR